MVMSWIFTLLAGFSLIFGLFLGSGSAVAAAVPAGAQAGITLAFSMAGSLCLWSALGKLMERVGITRLLARLLRPLLRRIFPQSSVDPKLAASLSGNICAYFFGLGNAATPLGIQSIQHMTDHAEPHRATDQMCRLVVLNTASIQLIPSNVAAIRASLGCATPFDILPAVWLTSLLSAGVGVTAAFIMGKVWRDV